MSSRKKQAIKFTILLLFITSLVLLIQYFDLISLISIEKLRSTIRSYGIFAPIISIAIWIIALTVLVPLAPLAVGSGAIFGVFWGTIYTIIGITIGSLIPFLIAKSLGEEFVTNLFKNKYESIHEFNKKLEKNGFLAVALIRFMPLIPHNASNYVFGVTKVKTKDYILGTIIGVIPESFILAYFGAAVVELHLMQIILSIILLTILTLSWPTYNHYKRKHRR